MIEITISKVTDFEELGALWQELESRADLSFFQSWSWTGCLARERFIDPVQLVAREGNHVCALALFNRTRGYFGVPTLWLSESGVPQHDQIFIEHNGILMERGRCDALLKTCLDVLQRAKIDLRDCSPPIIHLSGVAQDHLDSAQRIAGWLRVNATRLAPFVDIDALRRSGRNVLESLSANTRYQIRRSERRYTTVGPLSIERAKSVTEALDFLTQLARLHQSYWAGRGKSGAFANPEFERFHRALICRTYKSGGTDLLRITAGPRVLGYLYNFHFRGHISAYQSGFDYSFSDHHQKPGLTSHHLAIEMYRAEGAHRYDFLAGADRYKLSFAAASAPLHWIEIRPRGIRASVGLQLERMSKAFAYRFS